MRPNFNLFKSNPFDKYKHLNHEYFSNSPQNHYNPEGKSKGSFWIWTIIILSVGFIVYIFRHKIFRISDKKGNSEDKFIEISPDLETPQANSSKQLPEASKELIITEIQNEDMK